MKLIVRDFDVAAMVLGVVLHDDDCVELGVKEGDRVRVDGATSHVVIANTSDSLVKRGEVLMPEELRKKIGVKEGSEISLSAGKSQKGKLTVKIYEKKGPDIDSGYSR